MASRGLRRRVVLQVSPKLSREARPMFTAGLQGGTAGSAPPPRRGATRKVLHLRHRMCHSQSSFWVRPSHPVAQGGASSFEA
jgi:hypothetical protein